MAQINLITNATLNKAVYSSAMTKSIIVLESAGVKRSQTRGGFIGSIAKTTVGPNVAIAQLTLPNDVNASSSKYTFTVYPTTLSLVDGVRSALTAEL